MGEVTRIGDAIGRLVSLDQAATIYAAEPWTAESTAVVAIEPDTGGIPEEAATRGLKYFLEVAVARDFLEGWEATLDTTQTASERCARLIRYAIDDA